MERNEGTRAAILAHYAAHPRLMMTDIFKFLYQSTHGCEHMIASEERAVEYLEQEAKTAPMDGALTEPLDGEYTRVFLSYLREGLSPTTLGKLFCLSAKHEENAKEALAQRLAVAHDLAKEGLLPFAEDDLLHVSTAWGRAGYPPIHHSDEFREEYHPAYRVIANEYIPFLPLLARLDSRLKEGKTVLAIEGGSASGKTTLAALLEKIYGCTVLHMDDFFLRPEQRTPERLAEIGGNVDRERFLSEVLLPLRRGEAVSYRPYDCSSGTVAPPTPIAPQPLVVVEGAYSMHPELADCYDLSVFLRISPEAQKEHIEKRNSPAMAKRFFEEWIPLETRYFEGTGAEDRCDLVIE